MASNSAASGGGISIGGALLLIFVTLKLTGHIAWSWWWVFSPMWVPLAIIALILIPMGLFVGMRGAYRIIKERNKRRRVHGF